MNLGLKIDVSTRRGTREGVPRLVDLLTRRQARATLFFTLGPDHALGRRWLPGGDIGRGCREALRGVRQAGFETAIRAFDAVRWTHSVENAKEEWTRNQMQLACEAFLEIFDESATAHGAAGWQMNRHAFRLTQRLGFRYCSDTRGTFPFVPVRDAEIMACPQVPTTLPTLEELIGRDGITVKEVPQRLLQLSESPPATGHVFTLRAELGMEFVTVLDELLADKKLSPAILLAALADFDAVLGLDLATLTREALRVAPAGATIAPEAIAARLAQRRDARAAKDFARSDAIRDELAAAGVEVMDGDPLGWDWKLAL